MFRFSEYKGAIMLGLGIAVVWSFGASIVHMAAQVVAFVILGAVLFGVLALFGAMFSGGSSASYSGAVTKRELRERKAMTRELHQLNRELKRERKAHEFDYLKR